MEFKFEVIENFNISQIFGISPIGITNYHEKGKIYSFSKYKCKKLLKLNLIKKIENENYDNFDNNIIEKEFFDEIINDKIDKNNPYYSEDENCIFFENHIFFEKIEIEKTSLNLKFFKCILDKGIEIINSRFTNGHTISESSFGDLTFTNCEIKNELRILNSQFKKIQFNYNKYINRIIISEKTKIGKLEILTDNIIDFFKIDNYSIIEKKFEIWNNTGRNFHTTENELLRDFEVNNCHVQGELIIEKNKFSSLSILNSKIEKESNILNNFFEILNVDSNKFYERVKISKQKEKAQVKFCSYSNNNNEFDNLPLDKPNTINIFNFINNNINSIRIGHQKLKELVINNISNYNSESEINIGDLEIKEKFEIRTLRNSNRMRLYKINNNEEFRTNKNSKLIISDSTFGSAEFQEVKFSSFKEVQIYSSNLINIEMIDITWPDEIKSYEDNLEQQRNTYRMLKHSCMKQEDRIQALKFYAKEMQTFRKWIREKNKNNFTERFILWFNEKSSNFGLSWLKPIIFIFLMNFIFNLIFLLFSNTLSQNVELIIQLMFQLFIPLISPIHINIGLIPNLIFNSIINSIILSYPLTNIETIYNFGNELPKYIIFFDIIRKVIIGILLYQLIIAFRKYSRKI